MIYNSALFLLITTTIASYLGKWHWIFDTLSNFRIYYVIISIIFLLLAFKFKNKIAITLLLAAISVESFTLYHSYCRHEEAKTTKNSISEDISILQYNAYFLNKDYKRTIDYILKNQENLDIVFLQEVTAGLKKELKEIERYFPYKITIDEDWFDRAFYSKLPILNYQLKFFNNAKINNDLDLADSKNPYYNSHIHYLVIELKTIKEEIPFTIYGIHANAPFSKKFAKLRNEELKIISEEIRKDVLSKHKILIGDFNATPSSYWYELLEESTGMISSEKGTGLNNTWPSWLKSNLLRISIDNALISKNITAKTRLIGEDLGSDHLPVTLNLRIHSEQGDSSSK